MTISPSKLYDLFAASPLFVLYALAVFGILIQIKTIAASPLSEPAAISLALKIATLAFTLLQAVFLALRRVPVAKHSSLLAKVVAVLAANSSLVLLKLPLGMPTLSETTTSSVLAMFSLLLAIWSLRYLGRSFSILPQARGLVTGGPYRYLRHPLYFAEQSYFLAILAQYRIPWAALVFAISVALTIARITYEEQILKDTFPAYRDYARRVRWRLVPGLW